MELDDITDLLIDCVRQRELLFNIRHKDYRNVFMKENTWASVGDVVKLSGDEAQKRWRVARDNFLRFHKRKLSQSHSGAGAPEDPSYPPLYKKMLWYLKYWNVKNRTTSNFPEENGPQKVTKQSTSTSLWDTPLLEEEQADSRCSVGAPPTKKMCLILPASSKQRPELGLSQPVTPAVTLQSPPAPQICIVREVTAMSAAAAVLNDSLALCSTAGPSRISDSQVASTSESHGAQVIDITGSSSARDPEVAVASGSGKGKGPAVSSTGPSDGVVSATAVPRVSPVTPRRRINPPADMNNRKRDTVEMAFVTAMNALGELTKRFMKPPPTPEEARRNAFVQYLVQLLSLVNPVYENELRDRILTMVQSYIDRD